MARGVGVVEERSEGQVEVVVVRITACFLEVRISGWVQVVVLVLLAALELVALEVLLMQPLMLVLALVLVLLQAMALALALVMVQMPRHMQMRALPMVPDQAQPLVLPMRLAPPLARLPHPLVVDWALLRLHSPALP
jgi:hypothetical protein